MRASLVAWLVLSAAVAHGEPADPGGTDAVALLPFDARGALEIYGQPVANEIARSLKGDSLEVVVVGNKETVPDGVKLIVDGKIAKGSGGSVVLSLRIRNPKDGSVLDELSEPAPGLASIDKAAAALSAKLLPAVHAQLNKLVTTAPPPRTETLPSRPPPGVVQPAQTPVLIAIAASPDAAIEVEPLRAVLADSVAAWARSHRRDPRTVDASTLVRRLAPQTVAHSGAERGFMFEVLRYDIRQYKHKVPIARARVRVRIADGQTVLFDRVVVTDSIVGSPSTPPAELAARTAREVLAILLPHVRRAVPEWP